MATAVQESPTLPTAPAISMSAADNPAASQPVDEATITDGPPASNPTTEIPSTDRPIDPLDGLLDQLDQAVADLITGVDHEILTTVGDDRLIGFIRRLEESRNRLCLVDHEIVHGCEATDLPHRLQLRTVAKLLVQTTRIQPSQAHARVRAAHGLRSERSMQGDVLAPKFGLLAAAVGSGMVPAGQADAALRCLAKVERLPWSNRHDVDIAEESLADNAAILPPEEFAQVIQRIEDHTDPDGTLADDQMHEATRGVEWHQARDKSWRIHGRITPTVGAQINAVIGPLTKPRTGPTGKTSAAQKNAPTMRLPKCSPGPCVTAMPRPAAVSRRRWS